MGAAATLDVMLAASMQGAAQQAALAASQPTQAGDLPKAERQTALNSAAAPALQAVSAGSTSAKATAMATAAYALSKIASTRGQAAQASASIPNAEGFPVPDSATANARPSPGKPLLCQPCNCATPRPRCRPPRRACSAPLALLMGGASKVVATTNALPPGMVLDSDGRLEGRPSAGCTRI